MESKAVKIYVPVEVHVVLSQIQTDLKEKLQKKVALSEILFEFVKKGMENFSKENFSAILMQIQTDLKEKLHCQKFYLN